MYAFHNIMQRRKQMYSSPSHKASSCSCRWLPSALLLLDCCWFWWKEQSTQHRRHKRAKLSTWKEQSPLHFRWDFRSANYYTTPLRFEKCQSRRMSAAIFHLLSGRWRKRAFLYKAAWRRVTFEFRLTRREQRVKWVYYTWISECREVY